MAVLTQLKSITMLNSFEPKQYLSKRENGTYCIISGGMPLNTYTTKDQCNRIAANFKIMLPNVVWSAADGSFIEE